MPQKAYHIAELMVQRENSSLTIYWCFFREIYKVIVDLISWADLLFELSIYGSLWEVRPRPCFIEQSFQIAALFAPYTRAINDCYTDLQLASTIGWDIGCSGGYCQETVIFWIGQNMGGKTFQKVEHCCCRRLSCKIIFVLVWRKASSSTVLIVSPLISLRNNCSSGLWWSVGSTACLKNWCLSSSKSTLAFHMTPYSCVISLKRTPTWKLGSELNLAFGSASSAAT